MWAHAGTGAYERVKSEYTDPWGYYGPTAGVQEEQERRRGRSGRQRSITWKWAGATSWKGPGRGTPVLGGTVKPKITSPEKSHRVTSPSESSLQPVEHAHRSHPCACLLKISVTSQWEGKPKPKVPEGSRLLYLQYPSPPPPRLSFSNTSTEGSGTVKLDSTLVSPLAAALTPLLQPLVPLTSLLSSLPRRLWPDFSRGLTSASISPLPPSATRSAHSLLCPHRHSLLSSAPHSAEPPFWIHLTPCPSATCLTTPLSAPACPHRLTPN